MTTPATAIPQSTDSAEDDNKPRLHEVHMMPLEVSVPPPPACGELIPPPIAVATPAPDVLDGGYVDGGYIDGGYYQGECIPLPAPTSTTRFCTTTVTTTTVVEEEEVDADQHEDNKRRSRQLRIGAGVASGLLGLCLGGPVFAVVFGAGTAYATRKEGAVGDTARAVGEVAVCAGEKAAEIEERHQIVNHTKAAAAKTLEGARELEKQHQVVNRAKSAVVRGWISTHAFIERQKIAERTRDALRSVASWSSARLTEFGSNDAKRIARVGTIDTSELHDAHDTNEPSNNATLY